MNGKHIVPMYIGPSILFGDWTVFNLCIRNMGGNTVDMIETTVVVDTFDFMLCLLFLNYIICFVRDTFAHATRISAFNSADGFT